MHNLRKIRKHRIQRDEAEQALKNGPILIYDQRVETDRGRLLALIVTERGDSLRVVTAYDLDAGQRRDYHTRREELSERNEQ